MVARQLGIAIGIGAAALALACTTSGKTSSTDATRPAAAPATEASTTPIAAGELPLRLLNADGDPIAGIEIGLVSEKASTTDAEGRVVIELPSWRAAAPVVYLRATLPGGVPGFPAAGRERPGADLWRPPSRARLASAS